MVTINEGAQLRPLSLGELRLGSFKIFGQPSELVQ